VGSSFNWQRNLVALWIAQTLTMIAFSFVFPFIPLYVQSLGVKGTAEAAQWAGIIGAAAAISMSVAQPIWGNVSDRVGRRPMVIRSMLGSSIITVMMGLVTSPEQLVVLRFIQGGISGTVTASNALAAASAPRHRLGFVLGVMQVALFSGTSVGPLFGGVIADTFGYRASCFGAGILMLVGGLIVTIVVKEDFTPPKPEAPRRGVIQESKALFRMPVFPILIGIIFMIQMGGTIISPIITLFIASMSGDNNAATVAGLVLAAGGAVSAVSAFSIGRVSDRLGHSNILLVCLLGASLSYFPQAFVSELWQFFLLRLLLGFFLGGLMPSANALIAGTVSNDRRGAAFGLSATATSAANFIGPLSGAGIATVWGMHAVFFSTGILFAVALVWSRLVLQRDSARVLLH
jgi:MFS transporter, DHA1 family, multidrug resistance protein